MTTKTDVKDKLNFEDFCSKFNLTEWQKQAIVTYAERELEIEELRKDNRTMRRYFSAFKIDLKELKVK